MGFDIISEFDPSCTGLTSANKFNVIASILGYCILWQALVQGC